MLIRHHLTIRSEESDGQKDPQKYKNPNKSFQVRCKIFCEHLVYTFIYTFSLARTTFPNIKHSVVCAEFPMGYKIQGNGIYVSFIMSSLKCTQLYSMKILGFKLTFQKLFASFPNENNLKTDLKCRPRRLGDEENFSL